MPGHENSPGLVTEAVKDSAGKLNSYPQSTSGYPLNAAYEARLAGWLEGWHRRDPEIEHLGLIADRLYAEMCRRPGRPFIDPNRPSYAQIEQTRADIYAGNR